MLDNNNRNIRFLARMGAQGVLGQAVFDYAEDNNDFYAVSADLMIASGFDRLIKKHPEKCVNVGIAEQNLISVASGMTISDKSVIATSWAPFATYRCADQIRTFLGFMNKNVKIVGMGSGLHIARFGSSHYGLGDISVIRSIPNIDIICPCDGLEIYRAIYAAMNNNHPTYIRLTGGDFIPAINCSENYNFQIGKANVLCEGKDVTIISCGSIIKNVLEAIDMIKDKISCTLINMHTIKPFDKRTLLKYMDCRLMVTVEEHNVIGGLGSTVAEAVSDIAQKPPLKIIGIDDFFPIAGDYDYLLDQCGISSEKIAQKIEETYMGVVNAGG